MTSDSGSGPAVKFGETHWQTLTPIDEHMNKGFWYWSVWKRLFCLLTALWVGSRHPLACIWFKSWYRPVWVSLHYPRADMRIRMGCGINQVRPEYHQVHIRASTEGRLCCVLGCCTCYHERELGASQAKPDVSIHHEY